MSISFHDAVHGTTKELTIDGPQGRREVTVKIPPGINDGAKIRLRGKGKPGVNGGPPGNLYVRIRAGKHPLFRRSGRDLKLKVPITFSEAALGAEIKVPTLNGSVKVRVPAGTPAGKTLRISGKGVEAGGSQGDLLVTVEIEIPSDLSPRARELVEELGDIEHGDDPRAHLGV